jgi:hypothetical protein
MDDKDTGARAVPPRRRDAGRRRIRADLEGKGVATEFSQPVADRLAAIVRDRSPAEYEAILDGVAAAYGVHRRDFDVARDVKELQRLMDGFTGELRKLEEGLQLLSAYLQRMRSRATRGHAATFH